MANNDNESRPVGRALLNGARGRCPACETGSIFSGYLSVHDNCEVCDLKLSEHRADDGPAWATMLVVLHLLPAIVLTAYEVFPDASPLLLAALASVFFIVVTLLLLPRFKGLFIALQWANRMHGFGTPSPTAASVEGPSDNNPMPMAEKHNS